MHWRIYLWLSCVVLAGYVRAREDGVAVEPAADQPSIQNEGSLPDRDLFIDDDGSGVDPDESSGSGWGAGPGPDDEDGRGSGDRPAELPDDDEDYPPATTTTTPEPTDTIDTDFYDEYGNESGVIETDLSGRAFTFRPEATSTELIIVDSPNSNSKPPGVVETGAGEEQPSRPETDISLSGEDLNPPVDQEPAGTNVETESRPADTVVIMNTPEERATSFFAQPGILAAVIGGAVVGLLCAILVVMFIVYRMRKKDEGSYALDEPKRSPAAASYGKGHNNREFYA